MFLTVRRHAGNSRPGTGSVVRCEWRFQFSLIRENQCGGHEHVITLKSDNSSVWLSHDCSQSCAHRCSELWYAPSPDSQHVPALTESRCHHYAPATPPARPENAPAWHGIRHPPPGHCTRPVQSFRPVIPERGNHRHDTRYPG